MLLGVLILIPALMVLQIALSVSGAAANRTAHATIHNIAGAEVGSAKLVQKRDGTVEVRIDTDGLAPGFHGFHVHAVGSCDAAASFTTAGGHFNPTGHVHGHHAGDLPLLYVDANGVGWARFTTDSFAVADLLDADGSALIIHADPDNYANIPARYAAAGPDATTLATGDAGGRVACGVLQTR
jgi:Cu-Zn family superoxide dismutase